VGNSALTPNQNFLFASVSPADDTTGVWEQVILRYTAGSGASQATHTATIDIMVDVDAPTCDFDASAGTSVTGS